MKNATLEKLASGGKVCGTFFHSGSPLIMEAIGLSGLDFVVVDQEHSPIERDSSAELIRAALLRGISPFIRVADMSRPSILKALDAGAQGLVIPCVKGLEDVRTLVEYSKYPPLGNRGMAMGRGSDFGLNTMPLLEHWEYHNEQTMLVPMCETSGALEDIEAITATDGVAGIFVGPCDLSIALSVPGRFDSPEMSRALRRIAAACKAGDKFCFIYAPDTAFAKMAYDMGFDGCVSGIDVNIMLSAYRRLSDDLKSLY